MAETMFSCATCGNRNMHMKVTRKQTWRLSCDNGHVVPASPVGKEYIWKPVVAPVPEPEPEPTPIPTPTPPPGTGALYSDSYGKGYAA
jgi:hypothetical protein